MSATMAPHGSCDFPQRPSVRRWPAIACGSILEPISGLQRGSRLPIVQVHPHRSHWIDTARSRPIDELGQVDAPVGGLAVEDPTLRFAQLRA